ncbi:MAG: hypothetical protein FWG58_05195 [Methanomassiliicoccaceae archaeon]|nr:hypothetical protein [Methanomassiliicoccaceae archaeon]
MKKFFDRGRSYESASLEERYGRDDFSFAVVYGRRRIGKTSLITEFITRDNKKAIWFTATEYPDTVNLEKFSRSVSSVYQDLFYGALIN